MFLVVNRYKYILVAAVLCVAVNIGALQQNGYFLDRILNNRYADTLFSVATSFLLALAVYVTRRLKTNSVLTVLLLTAGIELIVGIIFTPIIYIFNIQGQMR